MVKLSVLYPRQEGARFDMDYYRDTHLPLARKLLAPALKAIKVDQGIAFGDQLSPYVVIGELWFESPEAAQAALLENQAELAADIPNYTDVQPLFQFSHVAVA